MKWRGKSRTVFINRIGAGDRFITNIHSILRSDLSERIACRKEFLIRDFWKCVVFDALMGHM